MTVTRSVIREVLPQGWRVGGRRDTVILLAPGNAMAWTIHNKEVGIVLRPLGRSQHDVATTLERLAEDAEASRAAAVTEAMSRLCLELRIRSRFIHVDGNDDGWFDIDPVFVAGGYLTGVRVCPYIRLEDGTGSLAFQPVYDIEFNGGSLHAVALGAVKSRLHLLSMAHPEHLRTM
jgi:hypothetical protein